ncbi:uncharacterized protein [Miscanthus floridulus]|uniref:uncharacterized protein n=1 Tax=Miscanthus floridulus TaxID=154761 RepID=UPI0034589648
MSGFDATAAVDAKTTAPPVHPVVPPATQGAPPPAPDAITKALAEIAQELANLNSGQAHLSAQQVSMQSRLANVESHLASSSAAAMPQGFPYGLLGPPIRCNCLSELAQLPFHSTVEDYQEHFNALVYHNANLEVYQKADLFMGGLPEHIHIDVELQEP